MFGERGPVAIRVHSVALEAASDDDAIGGALVRVVQHALARGGAPSAAVGVGGARADLVPLRPFSEAQASLPAFLASLSATLPDGTRPVDAVGLAGTFDLRHGDSSPPTTIAMVFLEWSDCRWWRWRALLDQNLGTTLVRAGSEVIDRAVDGAPRPDGLGGWWSLARRTSVQFRFIPELPQDAASSELVH